MIGLIELFSLGVTAEALRASIDRKSAFSLRQDLFDPKFQVEGSPPPVHELLFLSKKTRMNDLSCGVRMCHVGTTLFRFVAIHAFDRRTDGQTDGPNPLAIPCVALHDQLSLPSLRGREMSTSFGWEGKGRYGSLP